MLSEKLLKRLSVFFNVGLAGIGICLGMTLYVGFRNDQEKKRIISEPFAVPAIPFH